MNRILSPEQSPVFVISDLHLGSGSPRDIFSDPQKKKMFFEFLRMVESDKGRIIVLGDLMDLWRFNLNGIVKAHSDIFDALEELNAFYIPGNHDFAVNVLKEKKHLPHRFLQTASMPFNCKIGDKNIAFLHGHEIDILNQKICPSIGKALGLSALPFEHFKGIQISSENINDMLMVLKAGLLNLFNKINWRITNLWFHTSPPSVYPELLTKVRTRKYQSKINKLQQKKLSDSSDIIISAHTHQPGKYSDWYFNSGSWTYLKQNFLKILPDGLIEIGNWTKDGPTIIDSALS